MKKFHLLFLLSLSLVCAGTARAAEPTPKVTAQSQKIYYDAAEPVTARVEVINASDAPRPVQVEAWLESGLDKRTAIQKQAITVAPKTTGVATFRWPAKPLGLYGYALKTRVKDGAEVTNAVDYFTISDNYWNVALTFTHPRAYTADETPESLAVRLKELRAEYYNGFEKFFWAPDDFAELTPEPGAYYSGQARYHESPANIKAMIEEAHRMGMQATTYGKSIGSGSAGADFVRRHPEMVYRHAGRLDIESKVRALHYCSNQVGLTSNP